MKFLLVSIKINFFPWSWFVAFQWTNKEKMPFLFSTKLLFQFLIWTIGSEYIWQQLTKHEICWLRSNAIYSSLTTNTRTFLCVAAMEEIFWAALTIAIKTWRSICLYSRLQSSAFVMFSTEKQHTIMSFRFPVCNFPHYQLPSLQWCSQWIILGLF